MIPFLAVLIASFLDPIAVVLCVGLGFFLKSYWKGAAAGAVCHLAVVLLIPGIRIYALVVVCKLLSGAALGLIGAKLGKWVSAKNEKSSKK